MSRFLLPVRLLAVLLAAATTGFAATELYVAPGGDDAAPGTRQRPLARLQRARDVLRAQREAGALHGAATVFVREGTYLLADTLALEARDSGTAEAPVVFRAYPGERPVLSGGRAISGFVPHRDGILRADVSAAGLRGKRFRLLVFAGRRMEMARSPNRDPRDPNGGTWAHVDGPRMSMYADRPDEGGHFAAHPEWDFWQRNLPRYTRELPMRAADVRAWKHPEDGEVSIFPRFNWSHVLLSIEALDPVTRTLRVGPGSFYEIRPGDRYFVRGHLEDLDAPGEWHLDRRAEVLYFWPPEPLRGRPVHAPALDNLVTLTGCSDVTLRGFTLECCAGAGVVVRDCARVTVGSNVIRSVGTMGEPGIEFAGGEGCAAVGNDIHDTAGSGVTVAGGDLLRLVPGGHVVDNNYIHHVGMVRRDGQGIHVTGVGHRLAHNLIHDIPHAGIFMWGAGHTLEYNRLVRTCLESEDCGAIGGGAIDWLSWQDVTIRYNWLQDTIGFGYDPGAGRWRSPYFAHALYPDWAASGVTITGNVLVRAPVSCLFLHSGRDNVITNNLLIDGGAEQVACTGWTTQTGFWSTRVQEWVRNYETARQSPAWQAVRTLTDPRAVPRPDGLVMRGNRFERNIVSYRAPGAALMHFQQVPLDEHRSDYNLFYHHGQPLRTGTLWLKSEHGPNLLANPGLEEGPAVELPQGWAWRLPANPNTRLRVVEGEAHGGARSLLIAPGEGPPGVGYIAPGPAVPFRPGQAYRLSAWFKSAGGPVSLSLDAYSWKQDTHAWLVSRQVALTEQWREVDLIFRLPETTSPQYRGTMDSLSVRLAFRPGPGRVWVDDLSLREAETVSDWEAWQAAGLDRHSVVADPRFMDAAHDDYRLRPDSPALRLGFEPLPLDKMGCYRSEWRASWPVRADSAE